MEMTLAIVSSMFGVTSAFLMDGRPLGESVWVGVLFFLCGVGFLSMGLAEFIVKNILVIDTRTNKSSVYISCFITPFVLISLLFLLID